VLVRHVSWRASVHDRAVGRPALGRAVELVKAALNASGDALV
jgi:hypothetical protein